MLLCCNVVPSDIFRSISRCQGWLWTADRWPSVSPQPWVDGLPLDPARLWARSYGSKALKSLRVGSHSYGKYKIYLCASLSQKLEPIPITDQPSELVYLFNSLSLLYVSLSISLYCVSEMGVKQDYSLAVSACHLVFDYNFYFPFLGRKKKKNQR